MPRLRRVDCAAPAISRRRRGKGFEYLDESIGERIDDEEIIERIRALAIPPAWQDVWICADPLGHIQATGIDARGRKQYRYHARWRSGRDDAKFERLTFEATVERVLAAKPDVVGLGAFTCEVKPAAYVAGLVKARDGALVALHAFADRLEQPLVRHRSQ